MAVSFIGGKNPEYPEKTTDLPQIADKLETLLVLWTCYTIVSLKLTEHFTRKYIHDISCCKHIYWTGRKLLRCKWPPLVAPKTSIGDAVSCLLHARGQTFSIYSCMSRHLDEFWFVPQNQWTWTLRTILRQWWKISYIFLWTWNFYLNVLTQNMHFRILDLYEATPPTNW